MTRARIAIGSMGAIVVLTAALAGGQTQPRHITMEELHGLGGVPRGWKFTLPEGDAGRGRQVFAEAGCYKCHAVQGAGFPDPGAEKKAGPELTGMGGHHPAEYFAESIVAPNAVILDGPGYTGPDGLSIMPSYADSLSVRQLVDVVAFLKSQIVSPGGHDHRQGRDQAARAGDYTIRLVYTAPGPAEGSMDHHHGTMSGGHGKPAAKAGHLLIFVSDSATGDAVPYLPVTLTFKSKGQPVRVLRLAPMMSERGFHYGADAVIPADVEQVDVSVGPTTMKVMASARSRFARPARTSFAW